MIRECVSVSYGEIALKKDNKPFFERELRKNLKATLSDLNPDFKFDQSKVILLRSLKQSQLWIRFLKLLFMR